MSLRRRCNVINDRQALFDDLTYISIAVTGSNLSSEYLARLARTGRLHGRMWFIEMHSLQDANGSAVSIFEWGHPRIDERQSRHVQGVFETEHHEGRYAFYNEVEATKIARSP